jgi:trk/ktr system potassium uptake protein
MHVVIVGCGRVGSSLGLNLTEEGHSVVVIDRRPEAFVRLGSNFGGRTISGIGFDRGILREAGIEHADAVAAVTSGDNSNILIARVARENFGIARVVARIYDPKRAEIYQRLGIATVATVSWTVERVMRRLLPAGPVVEWVDPTAKVSLVERQIDSKSAGRKYSDIEQDANVRVVAVGRLGVTKLVTPELVAQEGDLAYLVMASDRIDDVSAAIDRSPAHAH